MDISVILVNFNTKKAVDIAVESCLDEGSEITREIIVIDNASSDGSLGYLLKKYKNNKKVILLKNTSNLGFSKAVNQGLKISKGKFKFLLNSDTQITKYCFKNMLDYAKSDAKIGIIGTKLILPGGDIQKSCFHFPGIRNAISEYWIGNKGSFTPFYKKGVSEVDAVVGASFLITPVAYEKVGLFDERYFMYFEDLDYCRRVKNAGLKVIYYPKVTIFHHHGLSGKKLAEKEDQWRRLVPSSRIYHGVIKHILITFVLWLGQKFRKVRKE